MRETWAILPVVAAAIGVGPGCGFEAVWDLWNDDGYDGPGPSMSGLVARPDDGRILVLYSAYAVARSYDPTGMSDSWIDDDSEDPWGPQPAVAVELRLLDEEYREVERRRSERLGERIEVWFEGVVNGRTYHVEGRAIGADRRYGLALRALVVPGVAPETERVWDEAAGPVEFSPDSRFLLLHSRNSAGPDLVRLDLETGESVALTDFVPAEPASGGMQHFLEGAAWSPDGGRVAYAYAPAESYWRTHEVELRLLQLDGGTVEDRVLLAVNGGFPLPFWLPGLDAVDFLAFDAEGHHAWWRVGTAGGPVEAVQVLPAGLVATAVDVSADGRFIALSGRDVADAPAYFLRIEEVDTGREVARVPSRYSELMHPALAPDGRRVAVGTQIGGCAVREYGYDYEVWILDLATERWTPLTGFVGHLRCVGPTGLDWSDDGRWVAVATCASAELGCEPGVFRIRAPDD